MDSNNDKTKFQTSEQFTKDLQSLFEPKQAVWPHVDRAVMHAAARRLRHRSRPRWKQYWPACAAAAAVIVAGVLFLNFNPPMETSAPLAMQEDINRDGTVDILDALKLAQQIQSSDSLNPQWDTNGDGIVNQKDVDTVAMAAVRMKEGVL